MQKNHQATIQSCALARSRFLFLLLFMLSVFACLVLSSCGESADEKTLVLLEKQLDWLDTRDFQKMSEEDNTIELEKLRSLFLQVEALDPAVLEQKLEDRRAKALDRSYVYISLLINQLLYP